MWTWGGSPPPPIPSWWWIFITRTGPVCFRRRGSLLPAPTPLRSGLRFGMAQTTVGIGLPLLLWEWEWGRTVGLPLLLGGADWGRGEVVLPLTLHFPLTLLLNVGCPCWTTGLPASNPGRLFLLCSDRETLGGHLFRKRLFISPSTSCRGSEVPISPCLESNSFTAEWSFLPSRRVG